MESFDHLTLAQITRKWTSTTGASQSISASGRTGSCLRINGATSYLSKTVPSQANYICGFAYKPDSTTGQWINTFDYPGGSHCALQVTPTTMTLRAVRNGNSTPYFIQTVLATSAQSLSENVWHYIETKVTVDNANGIFVVNVDGVEWINVSGVDTRYNDANLCASITFGHRYSSVSPDSYFDDIYIMDPDTAPSQGFLGDRRVFCLRPNGAGATTQWTKGGSAAAATNWESVDEVTPDDDVTNITDATTNHVDTYEFEDLTAGVTAVTAVQVNIIAKKDDVGARQIAPVVRPVATDRAGTSVALTTDYVDYMQVYNVNPETSSAWSKSEVDNSEFGVKQIT